jgi:hypothetical protein
MLPGRGPRRRPGETREAAPEGRLSGVRTNRVAYSAQSAYAVIEKVGLPENFAPVTVHTVDDEA